MLSIGGCGRADEGVRTRRSACTAALAPQPACPAAAAVFSGGAAGGQPAGIARHGPPDTRHERLRPRGQYQRRFCFSVLPHVWTVFLEGYSLSAKLSGKWCVLWCYRSLNSFQANCRVLVLKKQMLARGSPRYRCKRFRGFPGAIPCGSGGLRAGSGLLPRPGGLLGPGGSRLPQHCHTTRPLR